MKVMKMEEKEWLYERLLIEKDKRRMDKRGKRKRMEIQILYVLNVKGCRR